MAWGPPACWRCSWCSQQSCGRGCVTPTASEGKGLAWVTPQRLPQEPGCSARTTARAPGLCVPMWLSLREGGGGPKGRCQGPGGTAPERGGAFQQKHLAMGRSACQGMSFPSWEVFRQRLGKRPGGSDRGTPMWSSAGPHQCFPVAGVGSSRGLNGQRAHLCGRLGRAPTSLGHFLSYKMEGTVVPDGALKELVQANTEKRAPGLGQQCERAVVLF